MNDRRLGLALLAALVVIDLVLIGLALRPAPAATPASQALPDLGSEWDQPQVPTVEPVPARHIAFRAGGTAYAVAPGACDGSPAQAVDLPATGTPAPATAPAPVVGVVTTNADGTIAAVAGAQNCSEAQNYSQGEDGSWTAAGDPIGAYFVFPGSTDIATPSGPTPLPCQVVDMASTSAKATVLCTDGQLKSNSADTAWVAAGEVAGGVALAPGLADTLYALSVGDGCDGLQFSTATAAGGNWSAGGCVQGATASGPVGLAVLADSVLVVDGAGSAFRSPDGGASFNKGG